MYTLNTFILVKIFVLKNMHMPDYHSKNYTRELLKILKIQNPALQVDSKRWSFFETPLSIKWKCTPFFIRITLVKPESGMIHHFYENPITQTWASRLFKKCQKWPWNILQVLLNVNRILTSIFLVFSLMILISLIPIRKRCRNDS